MSRVFVIMGGSGAGKSTLEGKVRSESGRLGVVWLPTAKTRPRRDESDIYSFVGRDEIEAKLANGELLTYYKYVDGHIYALEAEPLLTHVRAGQDVVIGLDLQPALELGRLLHRTTCVLLDAPLTVLRERMIRRNGGIFDAAIELRLDAWLQAARLLESFPQESLLRVDATASIEHVFRTFCAIVHGRGA